MPEKTKTETATEKDFPETPTTGAPEGGFTNPAPEPPPVRPRDPDEMEDEIDPYPVVEDEVTTQRRPPVPYN